MSYINVFLNKYFLINLFCRILTESPVETNYHILGAMDSLEIIPINDDKNNTDDDDKSTSIVDQIYTEPSENVDESAAILTPQNSFDYLPSYMKIPSYSCCNYEKMTTSDWNQLKLLEETSNKLDSQRKSSVQFNEFSTNKNLSQIGSFERNSILKQQPSLNSQYNELNQQHNALFPIQQKCREAYANMKVESVLKMLCDVDDSNRETQRPHHTIKR